MTGRSFPRFCLVGALGFVIDSAGLLLLVAAGAGRFQGRAGSMLCAICVTWWLHRRWTFDAHAAPRLGQWSRYGLSSLAGASLNYGVYSFIVLAWPGLWPVWAVAAGSAAGLAVNYAGSRYFAFRTPRTRAGPPMTGPR